MTSTIVVPNLTAIDHIAYVKPGLLWVGGQGTLMQIDVDGNHIETVEDALCHHGGFAVTEDGDLFYISKDKHCINAKSAAKISTIVNLPRYENVRCICISYNKSDLLVLIRNKLKTQRHRVVSYDTKGNINYIVLEHDEGDPYNSPAYITENRNGDIVVSDNDKEAVVVLNRLGEQRYIIRKRNSDFLPFGVATDDSGNILVVEGIEETCIYVFDQNGDLTLRLAEKEDRGWGLCLDDKRNLYVGNRNGTIDVYRYSEENKIKY